MKVRVSKLTGTTVGELPPTNTIFSVLVFLRSEDRVPPWRLISIVSDTNGYPPMVLLPECILVDEVHSEPLAGQGCGGNPTLNHFECGKRKITRYLALFG